MKKVAVIFGGKSSEKEVSMHTGLAVVEAIKDVYDVTPINIDGNFHRWSGDSVELNRGELLVYYS